MARMAVMVVLSSVALLLVCGTAAIGLLSSILLPRIARLEPDVRARLLFRWRICPMADATIGAVLLLLIVRAVRGRSRWGGRWGGA